MKHNKIILLAGALSVIALVALSVTAPSDTDVARYETQKLEQKEKSKPTIPFQAEVASKSSWQRIDASSPRVTKAEIANDAERVRSLIGQHKTFKGKIEFIGIPPSNTLSLLHFGDKSSKALTLVLKADNYSKFPPISQLQDENVLVNGDVVEFEKDNGSKIVEIVLDDPNQVAVINGR